MTTRLLAHAVTTPQVATRVPPAARPGSRGLGSPGVCSGDATLDIWIFDDSWSVTGVSGTDPLALRYHEARLALHRVARACTCGKERVGILHFDVNQGQVQPTRLSGFGELRLQRGLSAPKDALGTSEVLPALRVAERWVDKAGPDVAVRLVVFSDFALTDDDPQAVVARIEAFPGDVTTVVLGQGVWPGRSPQVQLRHVSAGDRPGSLARTVFGELTRHRVGGGGRPL